MSDERHDELTHVDAQGRVGMVDVSHKQPMHRVAVAEVKFLAAASTIDRIMAGDLPKGEALAVARIAAIQAAKCVDRTIPLCHTLPVSHVGVEFHRDSPGSIRVETSVTVIAATGVEMEALSAASTAALTLWDMTKAVDAVLSIDGLRLLSKVKTPITAPLDD